MIIIIQLLQVLNTEFPSPSDKVGCSRIPPRCPHYNFIDQCRYDDEEEANEILEEVVRGESRAALLHISQLRTMHLGCLLTYYGIDCCSETADR